MRIHWVELWTRFWTGGGIACSRDLVVVPERPLEAGISFAEAVGGCGRPEGEEGGSMAKETVWEESTPCDLAERGG